MLSRLVCRRNHGMTRGAQYRTASIGQRAPGTPAVPALGSQSKIPSLPLVLPRDSGRPLQAARHSSHQCAALDYLAAAAEPAIRLLHATMPVVVDAWRGSCRYFPRPCIRKMVDFSLSSLFSTCRPVFSPGSMGLRGPRAQTSIVRRRAAPSHIRGRGETWVPRNRAAIFVAVGTACAKNRLSPGQR